MKNIILYGAPAAGKGTQCELLTKNFGYAVISIGQVLRNQRNPETEMGRIIIEGIIHLECLCPVSKDALSADLMRCI